MIKNIVFDLGNVIVKGKIHEIIKELITNQSDYNKIKDLFFCNWEEVDEGKKTIKEKFDESLLPTEIKEKYKDFLLYNYKYRDYNNELLSLISNLFIGIVVYNKKASSIKFVYKRIIKLMKVL